MKIELSDSSRHELSSDELKVVESALAQSEEEAEAILDQVADAVVQRSSEPSTATGRAKELVSYFHSLRPVPKAVFLSRIRICLSCEHARQLLRSGKEGDEGKSMILQCGQCNCIMNAKARIVGGRCPIGKFK
jgi:hypothetical protein